MPFLHKHCTAHYNSNKTIKLKIKDQYVSIITETGHLYEGDLVKGNRQRFGIYAKTSKCMPFVPKYRGNWYNNKRGGDGNGYYVNGGYYVGKWKNNMRFGYGKMWYSDGSFYAGDWKCDKRWGEGLFVDVTGNRYEGSWYKDERHGHGRLYHLSTGQMQEGAWVRNQCICTTVEDIPFRQTAVFATKYPIQPLELQQSHEIKLKKQKQLFKDDPKILAKFKKEAEKVLTLTQDDTIPVTVPVQTKVAVASARSMKSKRSKKGPQRTKISFV